MDDNLPRTVLLVDDDQDLLLMMKQALAGRGYNVETRTTPPSLKDLARIQPSMIFMDVALGGENGAAYCHAMKHSAHATDTIVLMSGLPLDELRMEAALGGADAFLAKPFNVRSLLAWVDHYLPNAKRSPVL